MSFFSRLARPTHTVGGRAYSSFFSSKSGGGRYLVSAKPSKPVIQPSQGKPVDNTTSTVQSNATTPPVNTSSKVKAGGTDENPSAPSKPAEPHPQSTTAPLAASTSLPFMSSSLLSDRAYVPTHPSISSKEYKLHQFFSLHRPLLLLDQSTSAIFESADPSSPLVSHSGDQLNKEAQSSFTAIDDPPESSPEADADAARQLAYTLVTNRVGATVTWQQSLSRLGFSGQSSTQDMTLAKETAQEWVNIHADSTRRKKRKKMKKHKLKKRRRLTRRQDK